MNHYRHHIGDYRKDTAHLSLLEHGIYRQLLDLYYLQEQPLSADLSRLMRLLCVRNADEERSLCAVLADFFTLTDEGYLHKRCERELGAIYAKSDKARESAMRRWTHDKQSVSAQKSSFDANAMRTHSEGNANGMLPSNPVTQLPSNPEKNKPTRSQARARFTPPTVDQVRDYCTERGNTINPESFVDHYTANGWRVGKTGMKDWQAAIRTWEKRHAEDQRTRPKTFDEKLAHLRRLSGEG